MFLILILVWVFIQCAGMSPVQANQIFLTDTVINPPDQLSQILKGDDYAQKAMVLNQLLAPAHSGILKSVHSGLQLDSIVVFEWSDDLQSIERSKLYTCTFADEGKTVLVDILKWDLNEEKWIKGSHNYYWFDFDGKLEEVEFQEYIYPDYRLYTRIEYVYENGQIKTESKYDRIDEIETWSKLEQLEYLYYPDSSLRRLNMNEWDPWYNDWLPTFYHDYFYDNKKKLLKETAYLYDYIDDIATKKFERTFTSDSLGNFLQIVEYIPGWAGGNFVPDKMQENTYDERMQLESETYYKYDYDIDYWLGELKWYYDNEPEDGSLHQVNSYVWNSIASSWQDQLKRIYLSDDRYDSSTILNWEFYETYMPVFAFNGIVSDRIENFKIENGEWELNGYSTYYYSDQLVGNQAITRSNIKIYPNPVVDELIIEIGNSVQHTCLIRNLNGQVVTQKEIQGNERLHLNTLAPGFFFVELFQNRQRIYSGKIIKR